MANSTYILFVAAVLAFSIIYLLLGKIFIRSFEVKNAAVTYESAKEALNRIASWTTWLTGLQTAAIAVMGLLFKSPSDNLKTFGFFAILFFGASIILATWLLSSLPSIQQRLVNSKEPDEKNDI